jgi:hypothetical protein
LEDINSDIPQLCVVESNILLDGFTEKEVEGEIMTMEHNKAPVPDGFRAEFYQKFWEVIKEDLMAMFAKSRTDELPLFKLNFRVITLLQKRNMLVVLNSIVLFILLI